MLEAGEGLEAFHFFGGEFFAFEEFFEQLAEFAIEGLESFGEHGGLFGGEIVGEAHHRGHSPSVEEKGEEFVEDGEIVEVFDEGGAEGKAEVFALL